MSEAVSQVGDICPYCNADRVVRNGKGSSNAVQRYLCRNCKRRFSSTGVIGGRNYSPELIGAAIESFYSGLSYRQVAEAMVEMCDISRPSKGSIHRWVEEYTSYALRSVAGRKAHTGDSWTALKIQVTARSEKCWNWTVVDDRTLYILDSVLIEGRNTLSVASVLRRATKGSDPQPQEDRSGRTVSFRGSCRSCLGWRRRAGPA